MTFTEVVLRGEILLTEGSVIEQLRRDPAVSLDPSILHAGMVRERTDQRRLARIYQSYLDVAKRFNLPMMVGTPTWRANSERLSRAGAPPCEQISRLSMELLNRIRGDLNGYGKSIFVGGLMGCRGDAYDPFEGLAEDDAASFHVEQAECLAQSGVDFLHGATLPALPEAMGMAKAMARSSTPYILSFVIHDTGRLLDGTPLHEAVARIDESVQPRPLCFCVNCVHPDPFSRAMAIETRAVADLAQRIIGLQANTSTLPPEMLDNRDTLDVQEPAPFAEAVVRVHEKWGTKILGGCCGTDYRHIEELARKITGLKKC